MGDDAMHIGFVGRTLSDGECVSNVGLSRLGGKPVWSARPSERAFVNQADGLTCTLCQAPLALVGQFSAGYGDVPRRLLHVFTCPVGCASEPGAWRVFRSTGPTCIAVEEVPPVAAASQSAAPVGLASDDWGAGSMSDDWGAPSGAADDWGAAPAGAAAVDSEIEALLQSQSSQAAPAASSRPKGTSAEQYEPVASSAWAGVEEPTLPGYWPCLALEIDNEPAPEAKSGEHEQELLERYLKSEKEEGQGDDAMGGEVPSEFAAELQNEKQAMKDECAADGDDLDGDDAFDDDENSSSEWLMKFQRRLARSPAQVVRYAWDGSPLWLAPPPREVASKAWPPCCSRCGSSRMFELQLLPTLMYAAFSIQQVESKGEWGTVVVYTCSKDCASEDPVEEFVVVQPAV